MSKAHILVLPFPTQGHINPLMDMSRYLVKNGIRVTFVNTEVNHRRVANALSSSSSSSSIDGKEGDQKDDHRATLSSDGIHMVSIPDGVDPEDDRKGKLCLAILRDMPKTLEELISTINEDEGEDGKISCVLVDAHMGWAFDVSHKMGIKGALVWPASATLLALQSCIPRLIDEGIIDRENGMPLQKEMYQLSSTVPAINTTHFQWSCFLELTTNKIIFQYIRRYWESLDIADWWICNSAYEYEPGAFSMVSKLKPIGPIMAGRDMENVGAQLWSEDSTCLSWLHQQPDRSVIYVAFGSFTLLNQTQFDELAHGLMLSDKPFLLVDRPGFTDGPGHTYPDGFPGSKGKIVDWAPQQKVLSHPSIACFLSHCGWNSTLEGVSNGVPFLCWPYFADQPMNQDTICDDWKVGLKFDRDENEIVTRNEIKKKVAVLLGDEDIKARSQNMKAIAVNNAEKGGQSSNNFNDFVEWLKTEI